jgi:hypothetical protein
MDKFVILNTMQWSEEKEMLRFKVEHRIKESVRAKCPRHPKFDPSVDQNMYSEPGCSVCADLRRLQESRIALEDMIKGFERRVFQWQASNISKPTKRQEPPASTTRQKS